MGCSGSSDNANTAAPHQAQDNDRAQVHARKKQVRDKWAEMNRLPRTRSEEDVQERKKLFNGWDPNGNGLLSLAEIDKGCREMGMAELTPNLSPILMRAYMKARDIGTKNGDAQDRPDFVNRAEFRLLLVYIYDYFELNVAFDEIDTSDDRRVTIDEFKKAVPKLQQWGISISDPEAEFKQIDKNGGGVVLFDEFSEWAIAKHLDVDGKENVA
eukprot:GILI01002695.1.p1 GENE.GILI01002695.1~~GILI01002695.1.p1  ORF type:complete len:227 (+),score=74.22 GILI01002695.1:45-683(+)